MDDPDNLLAADHNNSVGCILSLLCGSMGLVPSKVVSENRCDMKKIDNSLLDVRDLWLVTRFKFGCNSMKNDFFCLFA